jgi:putative sugar O-methyltransferase
MIHKHNRENSANSPRIPQIHNKLTLFIIFFAVSLGIFMLFERSRHNIVNVAKQHLNSRYESSLNLPPVSNRWNCFLARMRNEIDQIKTPRQAIDYAQGGMIGYDHRIPVDLKHIAHFESFVAKEFPHFSQHLSSFSESSDSYKNSFRSYNNRLVSNMTYFHMRYVLQCLTYVKPKILCDIGSGYGGAVRLWMTNSIFNPDICILIDFPECLFLAEVFLKKTLPSDIQVYYITDSNIDLNNLPNKCIVLCPIACSNLLINVPIDLATNTGSIQEMTDDYAEFWMAWLESSKAKHFYSLNYFGIDLFNLYEAKNRYSPKLSRDWRMHLNQTNPLFEFYPARNWVEIVAYRASNNEDLNPNLLKREYFESKNKPLTLQRFAECMDILRLAQDPEIAWDLITRINNSEMGYIPKEICYLIKMLKKTGDTDFLQNKIDTLNHYEEKYDSVFNQVVSNDFGGW